MTAPTLDQRTLLSAPARDFVSRPCTMLVNGRWVAARSGRTLPVVDPSTGLEITTIPAGGPEDIDTAVGSARAAFDDGAWPSLRPVDRERLLLKLADLIDRHAQELAELEAIDSGKLLPFNLYGDLKIAVDPVRYMAGWVTKIEGTTISLSFAYVPDLRFTAYTLREPILEAGIPPGVVNIVTGEGPEAGAALVEHPLVDKIAFTGSTRVGQLIQRRSADTMKRVSLELGGKSPVIMLADMDVPTAVQGAAQAIFFNHGQVCTAGSRLYIQKPIFEAVMAGLADVARGFKLGRAFDPQAQMGPLVSARHLQRVQGYVDAGVSEGARLLAGGERLSQPGFFLQPAVFANTKPDMTIVREEIFGPVVAAASFDSIEQIAPLANATSYGPTQVDI